jgi:hypothetical protein
LEEKFLSADIDLSKVYQDNIDKFKKDNKDAQTPVIIKMRESLGGKRDFEDWDNFIYAVLAKINKRPMLFLIKKTKDVLMELKMPAEYETLDITYSKEIEFNNEKDDETDEDDIEKEIEKYKVVQGD